MSGISTVVVMPARNEEQRIGDCLEALSVQQRRDVAVVLVANGCTDGTVPYSRDRAEALGLQLDVFDCILPLGGGVGTARRLGVDRALTLWPDAGCILTTDADCRVAPDWIARNRFHLGTHAAVCGKVEPMDSETSVFSTIEVLPAELEGRYERLVVDFYRRFRPGPLGLEGAHACAAGASLGVNAAAYRAVGGFADLATGEDRDLVRRLKAAGHGVIHAGDVRVAASCRLEGRAQNGMAEALRARVDRTDYLVDDALPPARFLVDAALANRLEPWPLQVAAQDRLRARDLAPHIALLEEALRHGVPVPPPPGIAETGDAA